MVVNSASWSEFGHSRKEDVLCDSPAEDFWVVDLDVNELRESGIVLLDFVASRRSFVLFLLFRMVC